MLTFELPWIALLAPLPWLVYRLWPEASREDPALMVPFYDRLPTTDGVLKSKTAGRLLSASGLILIWLTLLLAAARPMWIGDPINLPASGRDLLLAVDISGSMETRDMQWKGEQYDRLSIVKAVVGDFVQRRESDRLGLILFGTRAYVQAPLTFDRITVNQLLQEAQLGFAGEKTAIGDAIGMAVKRLRERPATDNPADPEGRVLILLTDGANTAGQVTPLKAAQLAQQAKLKIYTIGVGADEMVKPGLFGSGFGARRINPSVDLDEDTLRSIAEQTGGQYFRARSPQDLQLIYQELDRLEPIEQDSEVFRPTQALFYWPLGAALTFVALLMLRQLVLGFWYRGGQTGGSRHD